MSSRSIETQSLLGLCLPALLVALLADTSAGQNTPAIRPDAQRMDEVVRFYADDPPRFMGVVLVARGTDLLFAKGYGMANLEWSVPHTPTTKIPIGSNSKQFTAAAILLLEERGKLRVTDPIKAYLPDAPAAWDAITFHHLLSHTAGLIGTAPADRGNVLPARPDRTIDRFRNLPLQFAPGTNGMGAGSLYSTVGDLHRWMRALFGGKLLSPASLTKMTAPVTATPQGPGYEGGYGYGVIARTSSDGRREFYHGGSVPGFSSVLSYYPESQITIAVLNNLRGQSDECRAPPVVVANWLGTLAHGGTVTLPAQR